MGYGCRLRENRGMSQSIPRVLYWALPHGRCQRRPSISARRRRRALATNPEARRAASSPPYLVLLRKELAAFHSGCAGIVTVALVLASRRTAIDCLPALCSPEVPRRHIYSLHYIYSECKYRRFSKECLRGRPIDSCFLLCDIRSCVNRSCGRTPSLDHRASITHPFGVADPRASSSDRSYQ